MSPSETGHIDDQDFDNLNFTGLDENEWQTAARHGLPLILPWHHAAVRLGTGYHSSRQLTPDPWAKETPFILAELMLMAKILRPEQGTTSSFTRKDTSSKAESNDHKQLGFGVSLAPPIPVVEVSVKGTFDQQLQKNDDSEKTSMRASCRLGCIDLEVGPRLHSGAISELRYAGIEQFKKRYGDYYLAGYRFGADTGMLLSSSSSSKIEKDKVAIRVEAKVLFIKGGKTWETNFDTAKSAKSIKLLGYDTLEGRNWNNTSASGDSGHGVQDWLRGDVLASLQADADALIDRSESLIERVGKVLESNGVENGRNLNFKQCEDLCRAGVVVELLLLPMEKLRDVIYWHYYDDIV